ncbi:MAG: Biotin synthase [Syntrophaceae bacterium PtaU1.Bin231]|nr:MAG: Biotin synthase [Syntrophaceae bacterium PtaU1.Bin231]
MDWRQFSQSIMEGRPPAPDEALAVLESPDDELLAVLDAAFAIRRRYFGRDVSLHVIRNAKSGMCTEDCSFCSQSAVSQSGIRTYRMQSADEIIDGAREAHKLTAVRYCIVISGKSPTDKELDIVCDAARRIKQEIPIQICTSLGILTEAQARRLKEAGVDRYNHNLESSERFYASFCTTHSYGDRARTGRIVKAAGMELCSGGLIGMGETLQDRVDMAFALRALDADSIPVNFLDPRPGTPLEDLIRLRPADCLRTLAMFRFVNPDKEIRIAGGRENCIGSMQVLALYAANSMFTQGYLTTPGQGFESDMAMVSQAGFRVSEILE